MSAALLPNARWDGAAPRLSVLTPFHRDDPRSLLAALATEAQAVGGAVEVVLLDDAGGDPALSAAVEAAAAALPLPALLIRLPANEGRARGRNRLAAAARGRHLLFVDSDMLPDAPDFLRAWLALCAEADPTTAFGGFSLEQTRPGPAHRLHHAIQAGGETPSAVQRALAPGKWVCSSNLLVRRDVLEAEPFDEGFRGWGWEDTEWGARVHARCGVRHVDNPASHLGLDTAPELLAKYDQSPANFARLHARHPALVEAFPTWRYARLIRRLPGRRPLRRALRALALSELAPLRARTAALRLYRAALYAEVAT